MPPGPHILFSRIICFFYCDDGSYCPLPSISQVLDRFVIRFLSARQRMESIFHRDSIFRRETIAKFGTMSDGKA